MKNNAKALTPLYIVLIPVVLVVIVLNSGLLQRFLPAATVHGIDFKANQYNYYYFSVYNELLESDYAAQGFDPSKSASSQTRSDGTNWHDWLCQQAEERISFAVYYTALAEEAGYTFSQEELAPAEEALDRLEADAAASSISMKDYYVAYYGSGMTESVFRQELDRETRAEAYRTHLVETAVLSADEQAEVDAAGGTDFTANLQLIVLSAATDRFTGQTEERQLNDLGEKLDRLLARYTADPGSFSALAASYSALPNAAENGGMLANQRSEDLPESVAEWCFSGEIQPGDLYCAVDRNAGEGYLAVFTGWGESAAQEALSARLREEQVENAWTAARADYQVTRHAAGMKMVGN